MTDSKLPPQEEPTLAILWLVFGVGFFCVYMAAKQECDALGLSGWACVQQFRCTK
jgi:hypothetical protein